MLYVTRQFSITVLASIYGLLGISKVNDAASILSFAGVEWTEDNSIVSYY